MEIKVTNTFLSMKTTINWTKAHLNLFSVIS